jgi:hypothetical protein
MGVDAMTRHILNLCERHSIEIEWRRRGGLASREFGFISIPPIRSAITYAVALHEIGHVLGRHQTSRSVIVRERWAWAWARHNAIAWTPAMERAALRSLAWYERRRWPPVPTFGELNPHIPAGGNDA